MIRSDRSRQQRLDQRRGARQCEQGTPHKLRYTERGLALKGEGRWRESHGCDVDCSVTLSVATVEEDSIAGFKRLVYVQRGQTVCVGRIDPGNGTVEK
jgi:hypothetical protein